jgi:AcrR family transcriptional regulator
VALKNTRREVDPKVSPEMSRRLDQAERRVQQMLSGIPCLTDNPDLLQRRRKEIVAAALHCFARDGFERTTVTDIAQRAGVDKRTVYDYVKDKTDILYLLFLHYLPAQLRNLASAVDDSAPALDQLRALVERHIAYVEENHSIVLLLYREMRHLHRHQITNLLGIIDEIVSIYDMVLERAVEEGFVTAAPVRVVSHAVRAVLEMPGLTDWDLRQFNRETVRSILTTFVLSGAVGSAAKSSGASKAKA